MIQYLRMKRLVIIFSFVLLLVPSAVWAQTSTSTACDCFCRTTGGAVEIGSKETVAACQTSCKESGDSLLGCYTDTQETSRPENNQLCWTSYECTTQVSSALDTAGLEYDWGGQKTSCIPGEGFCYAPQPPVTLGVAIRDLTTNTDMTEAADFPTYINVVYNWLIPAAALVAIVMIMIGGLQYALARGDGGKITKAKERIKNAVIGMILLMFTYAILNLIDPDLVTLNKLRTPQIRQTVYLDPNSTCETMAAAGVIITQTGADTTCGNTGVVASIPEDSAAAGSTITAGQSCIYSTCSDGVATCMSVASAPGGYACVSCSDSYNDALIDYQPNPDAPPPTRTTCGNLLYTDPFPTDANHYYCEFYDTALTEVTVGDSCAELVYPANSDSTNLDCVLLLSDAYAGDSMGCRMYDNVWAKLAGNSLIYNNEVDDLQTSEAFPLLNTVCEADPCGLAPPGGSCQVFTIEKEMLTGTALLTFCGTAALASMGLATGPCIAAAALVYAASDSAVANCSNNDSYYGIMECKDKYGAETDCNPTW